MLVIMEKLNANTDSAVEPVNTYSVLHPDSDQVQIALRNLSAWRVTVQAKSYLATITAVNEVPQMLAPKMTTPKQNLEKDDKKSSQ